MTGCNWPSKSKAQSVAYDFLVQYFNYDNTEKIVDVDSYNKLSAEHSKKFKQYMTSKAYDSFVENKTPNKIFDIAAKGRTLLEFTNINLVIKEEYPQENTLYFEYSGDLLVDAIGAFENEIKKVQVLGEIILTKEGSTYKVSHFILRETQELYALRDSLGNIYDN